MKYTKIMRFALMSVLCGFIPYVRINAIDTQPEIFDINKTVGIIHNGHDCNTQKWQNKEEDTCQCCLSYSKGQVGNKKTADQTIDYCINETKQCTKKSIENLNNSFFLYKAFKRALIIFFS